MTLSFSIVVNTLNRAQWLADALRGLQGLDYPNFEVVVVNGPSTDNSQEIIDSFSNLVKIAQCPEPNLSMSRNIGIEAAVGDVVVFIDDDAVPHPDWLSQLAKHYSNPLVGGVGGFTIDNTGVRFQVRKTICDRFGNAYNVHDFFDERPLCFPGAPFFPSLLGTNSSFRRSVLHEIGGFDHAFAYLLDETDVCLRIVDAGYEIRYEPHALVYHQFAPSGLRSTRRLPKTLYPSVVSKSYFIETHGRREELRSGLDGEAARQLAAYRDELIAANKWMAEHGEIGEQHRVSLDQDVFWGIRRGIELAREERGCSGDLDLERASQAEPLKICPRTNGLRIALISQSFPPDNEAGIARWTSLLARGLSARGNTIHVIAHANEEPSVCFKDGYWEHRIKPDHELGKILAAAYDLPPNIASWNAGVALKVQELRQMGIDVASFPIWDLEGAALFYSDELAVVMSLHTTYAMALPFKPEWNERPLYRHHMIDKMIRHEAQLVSRLPVILANSSAIIDDLSISYGEDFRSRAVVVPHGTLDPFLLKPERRSHRGKHHRFSVAFVGRFEPRKGIDIAIETFAAVHKAIQDAQFHFVGENVGPSTAALFRRHGGEELLRSSRVTFHGSVDRSALDDLYASVDLVFVPSRYESFGLVAIEAMAAGAIVLASQAGGLKEVVAHELNGYLIPLDGSEASSAASHMVALSEDRALRKRMSAAARSAFEESFSIELMAERAEAVYSHAVKLAREKSKDVS